MKAPNPSLVVLAVTLVAAASSGCRTRVWPEPMRGYEPTPEELAAIPPPSNLEELTVLRHSDPVHVRRPGALSAYPLSFYKKRDRLDSGSMVLTGPGGRAEILWPASGTTIILFEEGACEIGDLSRGDPTATFRQIDRLRLHLNPDDRMRLLGGALLRSLGEGRVGPFVVHRIRDDILRIQNQTKSDAQVAFRNVVLELSSGQVVDLPLLSEGGKPFVDNPDERRVSAEDFHVDVLGDVQTWRAEGGLELLATGDGRVTGQGVRLQLSEGDRAIFTRLTPPTKNAAVPPATESPEDSDEGAVPEPLPEVETAGGAKTP